MIRLGRALKRVMPPLLDSYLLKSMAPPMAAAFGVVLIALMLDRTLELFNLLASSSARFGLIVRLMGNLVPHYLGLALPAAYFISVFLVVARLSDTSEVDALLASGVSISRLTVPFVVVGAVIAIFSIFLLGYIQPFGRYGYNSNLNAALTSGWDARMQPRTFISPKPGQVLTAERTDPAGRTLRGVYIRWLSDNDTLEQVVTADLARMRPSKDGKTLDVLLEHGQQYRERRNAEPVVGGFERLAVSLPFSTEAAPFRLRGAAERELTLAELKRRVTTGATYRARERAASEFYIRLVRSISVPLLPLLALPLGMAAKRGKRGFGVAVSAVILLLYEHGIELGQSVADTSTISPVLAVWTPFAVFAGLCGGLFLTSRRRPGETPFNLALDAMAELTLSIRRRIDRLRGRKPATA